MLLFTPDRLIEALQWKTRQVEQLDSASALAEIVMQLQWLFELPLVVETLDHYEAQFDLKLHEYGSLFDSSSKTIAACLMDLQGDPEVWSSAWAFDKKEVQEKTKNKVLASIDFYLQPPTDLEFSFTSSLDFHQHKRNYLKHLQTLEDAAESLRERLEGRQTRPEDQLGVLGVLIAAATQIREAFARFEFWREHSVPGAFDQLGILWDVSRMKSPRSLFGSNRAQIKALQDMLLGKGGPPEPDMALVYVQLYKKVLLDLQVHLASQHSKLAVIHRFKAKVMWYKKEEYRNLATAPSDTSQQKQCEDRLALIMAEYLFDAGYPVFVKAALKNLELDVLGLKHALLIEAKVSTTGTTKNHLISGLAQTIAYLNAISGTPLHVDEAFYVVFRLDGILFEFPHIINTGRFTIYPVVIDVAKSTDGGSRTKHVTQVTAADIQKQLDSHPRTRKQGA